MAAPARGSAAGGGAESFSGPAGPGAQHTGWDGALLELHGDGRFVLELWRFWETWGYIPQDQGEPSVNGPSGPAGPAPPAEGRASAAREVVEKEEKQFTVTSGTAGLRVREVEEVRVTFQGKAARRQEAPAIKFQGFARQELNQAFMGDAAREVGGQPTWWSCDGRYFAYFVEEDQHWKVNGVRLANADGLKNVKPGARRAGRGFAHSGPAWKGQSAVSALQSGDGWFECMEEEWEPAEVQALVLPAWEFTFCADSVVVEERHARGEESHEDRHIAPEVSFRGWRHSPAGGEMRVVLPPIPDRHMEGEIDIRPMEVLEPEVEGATNFLGDPDVVLLRPTAKL